MVRQERAPDYVELFNLGKTYDTPTGAVSVVREFNLRLAEGELVSLIGHSGCGKSTVLTMVAGLNAPSSGSVIVANREVTGPGTDRGVVFQSPSLLPWSSAFENVALGARRVYPQASRAELRDVVRYYLALVGLDGERDKLPRELSRGMQQRVGIARAFALRPRMLLLDEPFGSLDMLTRLELQDTLQELLAQDPKTTLLVTHDVDEALLLSDRVVMMTNGPEARVGRILEVPWRRPRARVEVLEQADYYGLRGEILAFLEAEGQRRMKRFPTATSPDPREEAESGSQVA